MLFQHDIVPFCANARENNPRRGTARQELSVFAPERNTVRVLHCSSSLHRGSFVAAEPSAARRRATPAPIPREEPVTRASLFSSDRFMVLVCTDDVYLGVKDQLFSDSTELPPALAPALLQDADR
jgi:hypothetical protein